MKTVSVVIPAHNAEHTIAGTLASLAGEAAVIGEILLVDDGSSDRTAEVARRAAAQHGLVLHVIPSTCRDAGASRNLALDRAAFPWIYLIDADDLHLPGGLTDMLARAGSDAGMVVGGCVRRVDGEDRKVKLSTGLSGSRIENASIYVRGEVSSIAVGSALVSRAAMGADRFPVGLAYDEDTLFWARLISRSALTMLERPVMVYNVCTQRSDSRFVVDPASRFLDWRRELHRLADCGIPKSALKTRQGIVALKIARVHYARGDFGTARRFLSVARASPRSPANAWRCLRYGVKLFMQGRLAPGNIGLQNA